MRVEGVERATGPAGEAEPGEPAGPAGEGDPARGEQVFTQNCASCHGPDAAGGALGPTLVSADLGARDDDSLRETISNGRPGTSMPAWSGALSSQNIEDAIAFLRSRQP